MVLCVDKKTQVQALDRLAIGSRSAPPGRIEVTPFVVPADRAPVRWTGVMSRRDQDQSNERRDDRGC